MVLPEDSDNALVDVLKEIAESLERNTDILNRIANHYDGVVPVMTRNANRAEAQGKAIDEEMENSFGEKVRNIFSPQTN